MIRRSVLLLSCLLIPFAAAAGWQATLKVFAKVSNTQIEEMSGIVMSRRYPDTYWVHNDSGDEARIFAIRQDGSAASPSTEGIRFPSARNIDWEDIAADGKSLFIADLGNNNNARKNLSIYVVPEPNPSRDKVASGVVRLPVRYEDQTEFPPTARNFDCEAIFTLRGKLFAITKHRLNALFPATHANLYRLDTRWTDKVNNLKKVDSATDLGGWVTAADVSPDGKTLAVLTHAPIQSVWLFSTAAEGDKFLSKGKGKQIIFRGLGQCEAICWIDAKTLIATNEQGELFKIHL